MEDIKQDKTYTMDEMEQLFPGFAKQLEQAKAESENKSKDGITIDGHHYTAQQLDWMFKHPQNQQKKWTAAKRKARNKKNKAASKQRRKNRGV